MNLTTDRIDVEIVSDGGESRMTESHALSTVRDLFRGATPVADATYTIADIESFTTVNGIITTITLSE